ncbi:unnamed protein product [Rodentolepis nana]|uniref:Tubulin--tyrosine ligase-like protein 12 n=1 Tax=Rodentolepis nana TaxID=102285 RepID=A0A0R3TQ71_RODNA|nr:unnamed protein product [Rodentolepis nana]
MCFIAIGPTARFQRVIGCFECRASLAWFRLTLQKWSASSNVVFVSCKMEDHAYMEFLRLHRAALTTMKVPEIYWPTIHSKLRGKVFDASEEFELGMLNYLNDENETVDSKLFVSVKVDEIKASDPNSIFLSDHAWTFQLEGVRRTLETNPILLPRMKTLMCINEDNEQEAIEAVMRKMWKFCRLYQISEPTKSEEGEIVLKMDVWYILDEFGSSLQQSSTPNVNVASLVYVPEQLCYSLFWPTEDLHKGDTLTVDWVSAIKNEEKKALLLIPWEGGDFSDRSSAHSFVLTDEFFSSHKMQETLPDPSVKLADNKKTPLLVYTDMDLVAGTLTSPNYKLTDNRDEADIIWTRKHIRDYENLSRTRANVYVNQFPYESVVTVKDMLAAVAASEAAIEISGPGDAYDIQSEDEGEEEEEKGRSSPKRALIASWYPVTFNLYYELAQFVAFFQRRAEEIDEVVEEVLENGKDNGHLAECSHAGSCLRCGKDGRHVSYTPTAAKQHNIWIVKPWNLGRGLGICISDNLDQIIRLNETNPMIASRYITDPVLFYREDISSWVKFDVRYVVYLKSVKPLQLYSHKVFWLRFANTQFSLDHFDDYSKHFTVMNYREDDELFQVHHNDFIQRFESQYPNAAWKDIEAKIHKMLVNVFKSAIACEPPRGLGAYGKSRALYAVDLLLEWRRCPSEMGDSCGFTVEPQICEVNFIPDCTRACQYYPDFHNEAFDFLFLDKESQDIVQLS